MLITNVNPSASEEIQALSTNPMLILNNSQTAYLIYPVTVGQSNPIWQTLDNFAGGSNPFWCAGSTLVNIMNANNNPRRQLILMLKMKIHMLVRIKEYLVLQEYPISA
jgi:hypothetical protein